MSRVDYGTVLKVVLSNEEISIVMLINNHTAGNEFDCMVLDLSTKEILLECSDIQEFIDRYDIIEVIGSFDDLFCLQD